MKFLDELRVVERTVANRAIFENTKETVFSKFRRSCLDLKSAPELLEDSTPSMRVAAWYMLLELSKSKLRRKHTGEVATQLLQSTAWRDTLQQEAVLIEQARELPDDFLLVLGLRGAQVTTSSRKSPIIQPASPMPAPVARAVSPADRSGTNPFAKGGTMTARVVDPKIDEWWDDTPGGPDYQQIFLVHKTLQLQNLQEKILNQQNEILSRQV